MELARETLELAGSHATIVPRAKPEGVSASERVLDSQRRAYEQIQSAKQSRPGTAVPTTKEELIASRMAVRNYNIKDDDAR
jgi:hypothetical protein